MRTGLARLIIFAAASICLVAAAQADKPFAIDVRQVFQGRMSDNAVNPLHVEVRNKGADASGVLNVIAGSSSTAYPIDLPRGADKALVVYPPPTYGEIRLELQTNQGNLSVQSHIDAGNEEGQWILMISNDGPGELGFLQPVPSKQAADNSGSQPQSQLWDVYSRPGESPTRPIGYDGINAIVLGPGAERLTDEEVAAIKEWLLAGHTLVFVGGASAPILSDPRWSGVLPVHGFHVAQLEHSAVLENLGKQTAPPLTITTGVPNGNFISKQDGDLLVYAEQPFGLGRSLYLSFNPFDAPFNKWEGKREAMTHILRVSENLLADAYIRSYSPEERASIGSPAPSSGPAYPSSHGHSIANDPFDTKLPATERILYILIAYFLAVVPLNFLLLKKFKRGELAWVTAPVISLGFAAILFMSASSLYKAKMSTVSTGIVLGQDGDQDGVFMGETQMFIPRAGSYDLKLKGVDSLTASQRDEYSEEADSNDIQPEDIGEIAIPNMTANNLSFKKIAYHQLLPVGNWFHIRLIPQSGSAIECVVSNTGPYTLSNAVVSFGAVNHSLTDLTPGTKTRILLNTKEIGPEHDLPTSDVRTFTDRSPRAALTGLLSGFTPGPQLGQFLADRSAVSFVMFSSWQGAQL